MKIKILTTVILLALLSQLFVACEKDYMDINKNPNAPTEVPGYVMFPAAVMSTTGTFATRIGITTGMWSQHFTQGNTANQFRDIDKFTLNYNDYDGAWTELYTGALNDYKTIIDFSTANEDWTMNFMATVMKAYTYQYIVDLWDNAPYSQAGVEFYPVFDKGQDIYKDLIVKIDEAMAKATDNLPSNISKYDMVFAGNLASWKAFANTLKLKMYVRMYDVDPQDAKITALLAGNLLEENAGIGKFEDADNQRNPLNEYNFHGLNTGNNLVASNTMLLYLKENNDPRYRRFYRPLEEEETLWPGLPATQWAGLDQGDFSNTVIKSGELSLILKKAEDPCFYISKAESKFLQAEALLLTGGSPKAKYDEGVVAALEQYPVEEYVLSEVDAAAFNPATYVAVGGAYEFPSAGTTAEKLEAIIQQKWVALYQGTNSTEAYIEFVRTGYPKVSAVSYDDPAYVKGQFVYPVNGVTSGEFPKRLPSVKDESVNNPNADPLVDGFQPIWWNK